MRIEVNQIPLNLNQNIFAFEVLTSFGLFNGDASLEDLKQFFGKYRTLEIERVLQILMSNGLVVRENQKYKTIKREILEMGIAPSTYDWIKHALINAHSYKNGDNRESRNLVISRIVKANKKGLAKKLNTFRQKLITKSFALESTNNDAIVSLVAACHPVCDLPSNPR